MQKKLIFLMVSLILFLFSSSIYGTDGLYVGGDIGIGLASDMDMDMNNYIFDIEFDPGINLGAAVGYSFGKIRAEGEIGWQKNRVDKVTYGSYEETYNGHIDLSNLSFLANGYYDFPNSSPFTPYVSAGIGFTYMKWEESAYNDYDDTVFAYQIGAGIGYAINERLTIDAKYRYYGTAEPDFNTDYALGKFGSHNFLIGVRVGF